MSRRQGLPPWGCEQMAPNRRFPRVDPASVNVRRAGDVVRFRWRRRWCGGSVRRRRSCGERLNCSSRGALQHQAFAEWMRRHAADLAEMVRRRNQDTAPAMRGCGVADSSPSANPSGGVIRPVA